MSTERLKILEKIAAGELTAAEAAVMLNGGATEAAAEEVVEEVEEVIEIEEDAKPTLKIVKEEVEDIAAEMAGMPEKEIDVELDIEEEEAPAKKSTIKGKGRRLRIQVKENDRTKVNISIPLGLLEFGIRIGERFAPELRGMNWEDLDINVDEPGEGVRIFVE